MMPSVNFVQIAKESRGAGSWFCVDRGVVLDENEETAAYSSTRGKVRWN